MNEYFLHFIWKNLLFDQNNLITENGEKIRILSQGTINTDAGPDFTNAKIKIDDTLWIGNIEIHTDSRSWNDHKHHLNRSYDNVILHVVQIPGSATYRTDGQEIPVLNLRYEKRYADSYAHLIMNEDLISCRDDLYKIEIFRLEHWLENLTIERLIYHTSSVEQILKHTKNNWEETLYIFIARSFGLRINTLPFELLAKSLPLRIMTKYNQKLPQLEALLFGQAGFLEGSTQDEYTIKLKKEFQYLRKIHKLKSIDKYLWKFMRLRPFNFPTLRIAQFAMFMHQSNKLFDNLRENLNLVSLLKLFSHGTGEYWNSHYNFGKPSEQRTKHIGRKTIDNIIINSIVPVMYLYSKETGNYPLAEKVLDLLYELPPEKNKITREWTNSGLKLTSAAQSQACIHLRNFYCIKKNCLNCQLGNYIIIQTGVK